MGIVEQEHNLNLHILQVAQQLQSAHPINNQIREIVALLMLSTL
jgi:hypothetical protein